ncbi:unnamed protein product [Vitrella brassicaformis CCMP3155]|uniref:Uncharacterized protein n=1 Tax=Vitrella brassicaformis (strain CCMP3155) TaxID=1169540 RepID=A0A0G4FL77_VITBC|nr:unnamed protein product [Vitrella brassicaformis CCMP3155]|mmetsp:Transcript_19079/g.46007  ORF Transcript_19079/g.46007 Transcript_19079/m.46007 type:complete len:194 (-) Transcript_19079:216-797(-)|eukprot:CEM14737.1 unnamed protein product [Vitrella brassicaformis CCMP3155]
MEADSHGLAASGTTADSPADSIPDHTLTHEDHHQQQLSVNHGESIADIGPRSGHQGGCAVPRAAGRSSIARFWQVLGSLIPSESDCASTEECVARMMVRSIQADAAKCIYQLRRASTVTAGERAMREANKLLHKDDKLKYDLTSPGYESDFGGYESRYLQAIEQATPDLQQAMYECHTRMSAEQAPTCSEGTN